MSSPTCLVNTQSTLNGVTVTGGTDVTIELLDPAGVKQWSLQCVYTDERNNIVTINNDLVVDLTTKSAIFTAPAFDGYGAALIFQSKINNGVDPNGRVDLSLTTTFGVYVLSQTGRRVHAVNETTESDSVFGWIPPINDCLRNIPITGGLIASDAGDGLVYALGTLNVVAADESIQVNANSIQVKTDGVTTITAPATATLTGGTLALRSSAGDISFNEGYFASDVQIDGFAFVGGDLDVQGGGVFADDLQATNLTLTGTLITGTNTSGLIVKTSDRTGATTSKILTLNTGTTVSAASGAISIVSGAVATTGNSGAITLASGVTASGTSGAVTVASGAPTAGASGALTIASGIGTTTSGGVALSSGAAGSGASGGITLTTGNSASGAAGNISLLTGTGTSGENISLFVAAPSFQSGRKVLYLRDRVAAPTAAPTSGLFAYSASGNLQIHTSTGTIIGIDSNQYSISGNSDDFGTYSFRTQNITADTEESRGIVIATGSSTGNEGVSGNINITTGFGGGSLNSVTGDIILQTGDSGLFGQNGNIFLNPGQGFNPGNIFLGRASLAADLNAQRTIFIANCLNAPDPGNPGSGGILFVEAGSLKFRGSSGTTTTIANA